MTQTAPAYFTKFEPHINLIDFTNEVFEQITYGERQPLTDEEMRQSKRARLHITRIILKVYDPEKPHTPKLPYYWDNVEFKGLKKWEIESKILREHMRARYAFPTKYGELPYIHFLRLMVLLMPDIDITPSLADQAYLSLGMFSYNLKRLNVLGSMNSGKSTFGAFSSVAYAAIDVDNFFEINGAPLEKTAKSTIFGSLTEAFRKVIIAHNASDSNKPLRNTVFPNMLIKEGKLIRLGESSVEKAGWCESRQLKQGGILQGAKLNNDKRLGIGLVHVDESNKIERLSQFERDLANVARQPWFQMYCCSNPEDETASDGLMSSPKKWRGWGWSTYDEIRRDRPLVWPGEKSSINYRLNAYEQPNLVAGKCIYPYLVSQEDVDGVIEDYGKGSREYYSQVLAIFPPGGSDLTLITTSEISSSRMGTDDYTIEEENFRLMSIDPSVTGLGDNAIITLIKSCKAVITHIDGNTEKKNLLIPISQQIRIPYDVDARWSKDSEYYKRYIELGRDPTNLEIGAELSYPDQIFLKAAELAKQHNIPARNVVYDGSCRAFMGKACSLFFGFAPTDIPLTDKPKGYRLSAKNKNTEDFCRNVNSECLYLAADVITSKQVRDPDNALVLAALQLARRKINIKKQGQPQSKADYKDDNGGRSPDEGDSWAYGVWMAFKLGHRSDTMYLGEEQHRGGNIFQAALRLGRDRKKLRTSKLK
jgi:hypothetical protein